MTQNDDRPVERPEDKDLQDHRYGMNAARMEEKAERGEGDSGEGGSEPHAGGRA